MTTSRLHKALNQLHQALAPAAAGLPDRALLDRFLATHDEAAFAALVHRHGPMVLGVCRRVLRHEQEAEDAFQATFLVLARKAGSVRKCQSLGSWLYAVAYRTALRARVRGLRRETFERQVEVMRHPEVQPAEPQDWRPLLDRELNRLPEKYRTAVVLCDLEGLPRKEAARELGVPEGTVSSRLAAGRQLLARRLSLRGLSLAGGALAIVLAEGASAAVPPALAWSIAKAAVLVAAGRLVVLATPAALLTKGVLKSMYVTKLKFAVAAILVATALGAGGLAYRGAAGPGAAQAQTSTTGKAVPAKPRTEVETLRHEVEMLRLNLQVVLEKVHAQEAELRTLRGAGKTTGKPRAGNGRLPEGNGKPPEGNLELPKRNLKTPAPDVEKGREFDPNAPDPQPKPLESGTKSIPPAGPDVPVDIRPVRVPRDRTADPVRAVEAAMKALRRAEGARARQRALERLEEAVRKLRQDGPTTAAPLGS